MINAAALTLVTLSAPAIASPDAVTPEVATADVWLAQLDAKNWNEKCRTQTLLEMPFNNERPPLGVKLPSRQLNLTAGFGSDHRKAAGPLSTQLSSFRRW